MSTDMIDSAFGHACCVAIHHHPHEMRAYRDHLVHQVGDSAPTVEEIAALGAEVSAAWAMGVNPRCFLCGGAVAKGGCCKCVVEGLPFRVPKAQAEAMRARGDKRPACRFACSRCGAADTMTAEQLLREQKSADGEVLRAVGAPYSFCRTCARESAMTVKAAKAKANALAAPLLAAARAAALLRLIEAQSAYDGALRAKKDAGSVLKTREAEHANATKLLAELRKTLQATKAGDAQTTRFLGLATEDVAAAQRGLTEAQTRFDAQATRANAAHDALTLAQASVQA